MTSNEPAPMLEDKEKWFALSQLFFGFLVLQLQVMGGPKVNENDEFDDSVPSKPKNDDAWWSLWEKMTFSFILHYIFD
ncbi:hypothetical protein MTR67_021373 [Solanum verrucosum]|uniref:Uncharacterized protein n=1 Tax=Solanum verrucosum TaxID=315347 RepID=A0AAF0QRG2_SOLVR|nr:hypothetical protein MTR67_021373 [Solanum verrucosum]